MMPPVLSVYGRLPAMTATQALTLRAASSHKNLTTTQRLHQRLHHRTFHTSPQPRNQRRPPPIRIAKAQPAPPNPEPKTTPKPLTDPQKLFNSLVRSGPNAEAPKQKELLKQHRLRRREEKEEENRQKHQDQQQQNQQTKPKWKRFRPGPITIPDLVFTALAVLLVYLVPGSSKKTRKPPLNPDTFVPFAVTAREQVSPTAFVLTVEPPEGYEGGGDGEVVGRAWAHGLWSVEVKQPELMVARDYTPLPAAVMGGGEDGEGEERVEKIERVEGGDGKLRFYVRKMEKGEVSGYLDRLKVGDTLELRGPRLGFDLRKRMGVDEDGDGNGNDGAEGAREKKKVVFLAGGTGIAPALQAARALLDKPEVEMEVVWANRRLEDCVGCGGGGGEEQGAIVAMLEDFRKRYGDRFRYSCTVDEEGSYIDGNTIARLTAGSASAAAPAPTTTPTQTPAPASSQSGQPGWGLWSAGATSQSQSLSQSQSQSSGTVSPPKPRTDSSACLHHSPNSLTKFDDRDAPTGTATQPCRCKDADGYPVRGGKNLLMVSGPEGFIAHFAGAKVWASGIEMQGPVNGVIGELKRKYPALGEDWLVLKL